MKQRPVFIFLCGFAVLLLPCCTPKEVNQDPTLLTVSPMKSDIKADPQDIRYTVTCDKSIFVEIPNGDGWAVAKPVEDKGDNKYWVTVSYSFNDSESERKCDVHIKSGSQEKIIHVTQTPWTSIVSDTSLVFAGLNDSKILKIKTSKSDWRLELTDTKAAPSWIVADKAGGKGNEECEVVLTAVEDNLTDENRNCFAKIIVGEEDYFYVTLTETPVDCIVVDVKKKEIPPEGGEITVNVGANRQYGIKVEADWIEIVRGKETKAGLEYSDLRFTVQENLELEPRSGVITFSTGSVEENVTVYQVSKDRIILGAESILMPQYGGSRKIELRSNIEYEITCDGEGWISAGLSTGRVDQMIVDVQPNEEPSSRTATITVRGKTKTEVFAQMVLTQSGNNPESPFESNSLGVFGYNPAGDNFIVDVFKYQTGRSTDWFHIIDAYNDKFLEISGLPESMVVGDSFRGRVVQNLLPDMQRNSLRTMTVYKINGNFVWLTDENAVGYTIKH